MSDLRTLIKFTSYWIRKENPVFEMYFKNTKALDVGCGEGEFLEKDKNNFIGVDINPSALERCIAKGLKVQKAFVTELPFANNSFDAVHCSNVIEHLFPEDARKMIAEMSRVLRVGGVMVLTTPMPKTIWNSFGHIRPYTPMSIRKLMRKVSLESFDTLPGLSIETVIYFGCWSLNKATFFLSTVLSNFFPSLSCSYLMIIKKYE